jgi:chromosomal replication initiator protein
MEQMSSTAAERPRPAPAAAATSEFVTSLLAGVARRIGPERYDVWFRNSTRIRFDGTRLEVAVPNTFMARLLDEQCSETIRSAARESTGRETEVFFVVEPSAFAGSGAGTNGAAGHGTDPAANGANGADGLNGHAAADPPSSSRLPAVRIAARAPGGSAKPVRTWLAEGLPVGRRCTLGEFVVGPCNRMAHAAAVQVAERPGAAFNPLFVHGACGLGKTHLLLGIATAVKSDRPDLELCYTSAEEFTNQFLAAMKAGRLDGFRREVRGMDVVILDDVHFLSGKDRTQEEFLNTFKSLEAAGRQVVLASDRPPNELAEFSSQLVSRFVQGMVTSVDAPDFAVRRGILAAKAVRHARPLPDDVLDYVAGHVTGNVRELEGAFNKLVAGAMLSGGRVDLALARELIPAPGGAARAAPSPAGRIAAVVAEAFGVKAADFAGTKRTNGLNTARMVLMYLLREHTGWTFQQIADHLDRKNHSTVLVACRKMQEMLDADAPVALPGLAADAAPTARQLLARLGEAVKAKG